MYVDGIIKTKTFMSGLIDIPSKKLLPAYSKNDHSSVACFAILE